MFEKISNIILEASETLRDLSKRDFGMEFKYDSSPVTTADKSISKFLSKELKKILDIPVLSEEAIELMPDNTEKFWLIDPIDGTKEFIRKSTGFSVNVSLIESFKPVFGCISAPALNIVYYAELNKGAYKVENNKVHRLTPQKYNDVIVMSKSHSHESEKLFLEKNSFKTIKRVGASLKFCAIASGEASIYVRFERLHSWDIAAGHLIAKEAGCKVYDLETFSEPNYNLPKERMNPFIVLNQEISLKEIVLP